jgi:hypothetical protein
MESAMCCVLVVTLSLSAAAQTTVGSPGIPLVRHYRLGEPLSYHMSATNQGRSGTIHYQAQADGVVKKDSAGDFVEEFGWSNVVTDGGPLTLSPASSAFRQTLSVAPNYKLTVPDLSQVQPILIGPIVDLLTFYADLSLVMSQSGLTNAGDHIYFKHGTPNSWADGTYTTLGEDSVDFDITLESIDRAKDTATVLVRHVPPASPQIRIPVDWMKSPVADTPSNWIEVSKDSDGKFSAEVGKETFDVVMEISPSSGKMISATLENPVEVLARDCTDAALTKCGDPTRYRIMRKISLDSK